MSSWDQYRYPPEPQKSFWRRALLKALLGALLTSLFFTLLLLLPLFLIEEPLLFSTWEPSLFSVPFLASIYGPLALYGAVVGSCFTVPEEPYTLRETRLLGLLIVVVGAATGLFLPSANRELLCPWPNWTMASMLAFVSLVIGGAVLPAYMSRKRES
jgi:energy-converting hydrogenase Eha subunit A